MINNLFLYVIKILFIASQLELKFKVNYIHVIHLFKIS